jgi:hypothetical protein
MVTSTTGHYTTNTNNGYSRQGGNGLDHMSTAVLPHFFSTGLVDPGVPAPHTHHGVVHPHHPEHPHQQQYPSQQAHLSLSLSSRSGDNQVQSQFFDDASYPQLGPPVYDIPGSVNVGQQASIYPSQQYSSYSACPISFFSSTFFSNKLLIPR